MAPETLQLNIVSSEILRDSLDGACVKTKSSDRFVFLTLLFFQRSPDGATLRSDIQLTYSEIRSTHPEQHFTGTQPELTQCLQMNNTPLTEIVCWTRMQAEAGEDITSIFARKELERQAGNGVFYWGVGNPPNRMIKELAAEELDIDVVFSLMKSRPKSIDITPSGLLRWHTYFDLDGTERQLPTHACVTSRSSTGLSLKQRHYALICYSHDQLRIGDWGPFYPTSYRNVGPNGKPVSQSQVTALLTKVAETTAQRSYSISFRARLVGGLWVKLGSPKPFSEKHTNTKPVSDPVSIKERNNSEMDNSSDAPG